MFRNKILFLFKRYDYNDNNILISKDLLFLPNASSVVITRSLKFIVENDSNEDNSDMNHFKNVFNKKRSILNLKTFKKMKIQKFDLIDIAEIDVSAYYHLIRNKENKFFSLIMNEICDTLI